MKLAGKWIILGDIIQHKITQPQKDKRCMPSPNCDSELQIPRCAYVAPEVTAETRTVKMHQAVGRKCWSQEGQDPGVGRGKEGQLKVGFKWDGGQYRRGREEGE